LTAEAIVYPKKASMPKQINHGLNHLNIEANRWIVQVQDYGKQQGYFVGFIEKLKQKAKEHKKKCLKGIKPVQTLYKVRI